MPSLKGLYVLKSFNGEAVSKDARCRLMIHHVHDGDEVHFKIRAKVVNNMFGDATYENGLLRANLASTEMMGPTYLMSIEAALGEGLSGKGMKVSLEDGKLTLTHGDAVLVYKKMPLLRGRRKDIRTHA